MTLKGFLIGIALILAIAGMVVVNYASRAAEVVQQQVDPAELLRKYEWFKDASAQLDKKQADIKVYEARIKPIEARYADKEMPRTIAEQYMVWQQELAGIKASYNGLAAEYNSQMSKINWRFCNVGDLPQGATEPLPRNYKPYEDK